MIARRREEHQQHHLSGNGAAVPSQSSVFAGRAGQMSELEKYLRMAADGSGNFIVISGEAGTGKSELARQFAAKALQNGARCISEGFRADRAFEPYAPFRRLIDHLNRGEWEPAAAPTGSQPAARGEEPGRETEAQSFFSLQTSHQLTQQHLIREILNHGRQRLLIITLREVHLAPLTAWQFIHYLSGSILESKILLLVTLRQDGRETTRDKLPVYADVLQRMNREGLVNRISLGRFGEAEIRQFLFMKFGRSDFSNRFVPLLKEISGGVPEQLVNCVDAMQAENLIYEQDGIWFDQEELSVEQVVSLLRADRQAKVPAMPPENLSELQRAILNFAALLSGTFDYRLMAQILGKPCPPVIKALSELVAQKVLIAVDDESYQFKFAALKSQLAESLPPETQDEMHQRIVAALKSATHLQETEKAFALAYHCQRTRDKQAAYQCLVWAGNLAAGNFAFPEARDFYRKALEIADSGTVEIEPRQIIDLLMKAAWFARILGDRREGLAAYARARKLAQTLKLVPLENEILIHQGLTYFQLNEWQPAIECFQQVLQFGDELEAPTRAMAHYGLGNVFLELSQYSRCEEHYQKGLAAAQAAELKMLQANILNNTGIMKSVRGRRMQAIALYSRAIPIYTEIGDHLGLARTYTNIGVTYAEEGNWQQANDFYGKSLKVADTLGLVPLKAVTFLNRARALVHLQRLEEAREYNYKARRLLKRLKDELGIAESHVVQALIEKAEGYWPEAEKQLTTALGAFEKLDHQLGVAETVQERGLLARQMGRQSEAVNWLKSAQQAFEKLGLQQRAALLQEILEKEAIAEENANTSGGAVRRKVGE